MEVLVNGTGDHDFIVFEDSFKNLKRLQEAIACSKDCISLTSDLEDSSISNLCEDHPSKHTTYFCRNCRVETGEACLQDHNGHECKPLESVVIEEAEKLEKTRSVARKLLEDTEGAIDGVRNTIVTTQERKDENLTATKRAFDMLRKALDNREQKLLQQIKTGADSKFEALKLQQEKLELLGRQVKNHINLVKQTAEKKMRADKLYSSRLILEQRTKDLIIMKDTSSVEPVRKEQALVELLGVEQLSQEVSNLGRFRYNGSVEQAWKHTVPVDQYSLLTVTVRDVNDKHVARCAQELEATVKSPTGKDIPTVIKEIGDGRYSVAFVPDIVGEHAVSVMVAGEPVPHSPYRLSVKTVKECQQTEQKFYQIITNYEGNEFCGPNDVAVGPNEDVIVADTGNNCVVVMDKDLNFKSIIGKDRIDNRMSLPYGVAASNDSIAVSETISHQVKRYNIKGKLISKIGSKGNGQYQFNSPKGLAFSSTQQLYIVDSGNSRVQVFNSNDAFAFTIGSKGFNPGELQQPIRIAIGSADTVYITDYGSNCIHVFSKDGCFINKFSFYKPGAITVSPDGNVLTGHYDDKIRIWSPTYKPMEQISKKDIDGEREEFCGINGLATNKDGTVYIVGLWNQ